MHFLAARETFLLCNLKRIWPHMATIFRQLLYLKDTLMSFKSKVTE